MLNELQLRKQFGICLSSNVGSCSAGAMVVTSVTFLLFFCRRMVAGSVDLRLKYAGPPEIG